MLSFRLLFVLVLRTTMCLVLLGAGVRIIAHLPPELELIDGGTSGMVLTPEVEEKMPDLLRRVADEQAFLGLLVSPIESEVA
jgi:hypothetical protein